MELHCRAVETRRLIERMVAANPLWGAPRIHGELKMLGIEISERTISRILRRLPRPPGQIWKTFLRNHLGQMVSIDFFTVPTITLKVLFVFIVLEHSRREVLHFNVTDRSSLDFPADCGGLRRTRNSALSRAGSGRRLWHQRSVTYRFAPNRRNPHSAPQPLAESNTPNGSSPRSAESVWTTSSSLMPDI